MSSNSISSSSYKFVILLPDARRETVKVTLDTSILQVLEDTCIKRGLNANEWNLKHYNRIIELGNSVRFSGLPNNATLELVQSLKPRAESPVNVVLQLESGKRLAHHFSPQTTLWQVLEYWSSQEEGEHIGVEKDREPTCIYMRQEVNGRAALEHKTLRHLGLFQGSAVIRLIHRPTSNSTSAPAAGPTSANQQHQEVSKGKTNDGRGMLLAKNTSKQTGAERQAHSSTKKDERNKPGKSNSPKRLSSSLSPGTAPAVAGKAPIARNKPPVNMNNSQDESPPSKSLNGSTRSPQGPNKNIGGAPNKSKQTVAAAANRVNASKSKEANNPAPKNAAAPPKPPKKTNQAANSSASTERHAPRGLLKIIGPNDAVMYHADDVDLPEIESPPDEFYSVTATDVRGIYHSLKEKRVQLEEAPLRTRSARNLEHDNNIQRILSKYPVTIVRLRLPDRLVLQATFPTNSSISQVYSLVRSYLRDSRFNFYLFKTPPRKILAQNTTLLQEDLVGLAVIYLGTSDESQGTPRYLKESLQLSDPRRVFEFTQEITRKALAGASNRAEANAVASGSKGAAPSPNVPPQGRALSPHVPEQAPTAAGTSRGHPSSGPATTNTNNGERRNTGAKAPGTNERRHGGASTTANVVPKWFKK